MNSRLQNEPGKCENIKGHEGHGTRRRVATSWLFFWPKSMGTEMKFFPEIFADTREADEKIGHLPTQSEITGGQNDPDVVSGEALSGVGVRIDKDACYSRSSGLQYESAGRIQ
jgi:hypothetical protein